ncbi:hypothetical protein SGLAM104S_07216 [Streptomyces glaucescens]
MVDVERAEAALVEHYPRLVRLAYLVLPPGLGRNRRVLTAHALTQRALPRRRARASVIPSQSTGHESDPGYAYVRLQVLRTALEAGLPLRRRAWPKRSQLPPLLPQVWGLRLFPRSGGADELALDQRLSALSAPARAAYVLRGLERLSDDDVRTVLRAAGVRDTQAALAEADVLAARYALLASPEFDPCSLQARPTDLMRRRRHLKAALAATAAVAVGGALLGLPGDGWDPDGAAAPVYAQNPAARAALDPAELTKVPTAVWRSATRTDFSVWPARGDLVDDSALLRRALAVWARPGETVRVSVTPGTPSGGPAGPPQLLYAGTVDRARVVILHDGLRIARYAEPVDGTAGAALDFARTDSASRGEASAVVLARTDGNVRYLLAPWVTRAAERDLVKPGSGPMELTVTDGIASPLASPATRSGACTSWNVLEVTDASGTRLLTDLGELVPARLTSWPAGLGAGRERCTGAADLGAVRLLAGERAGAGRAVGERVGVRPAAAAGRQRFGGVGVHPGGDLAGRRRAGAGAVPDAGRDVRRGGREGRGRSGVRGEGSARAGRGAVEVGGRRVVPARGEQPGHGVGPCDGRGERLGGGPSADRTDEAGCARGAEGHAGERAVHQRAAVGGAAARA